MDHVAKPGRVWVCLACGKRSRDRYGRAPVDRGWDVSCFLYAVLCREDRLVIEGGRVVRVEEGGVIPSGPSPGPAAP